MRWFVYGVRAAAAALHCAIIRVKEQKDLLDKKGPHTDGASSPMALLHDRIGPASLCAAAPDGAPVHGRVCRYTGAPSARTPVVHAITEQAPLHTRTDVVQQPIPIRPSAHEDVLRAITSRTARSTARNHGCRCGDGLCAAGAGGGAG